MFSSLSMKGEVNVLMVDFGKNLKVNIWVILCGLYWDVFLDDSNLRDALLLFQVNTSVSLKS